MSRRFVLFTALLPAAPRQSPPESQWQGQVPIRLLYSRSQRPGPGNGSFTVVDFNTGQHSEMKRNWNLTKIRPSDLAYRAKNRATIIPNRKKAPSPTLSPH